MSHGTRCSYLLLLPAFWSLPLARFLGVVVGSTGGANLGRTLRKDAVIENHEGTNR